MTTVAILFLAYWGLGAFGIYALWYVRDCPTWGHVWHKIRYSFPRARIAKC